MTFTRGLSAALMALLLAGCSSLPFMAPKADAAGEAPAVPTRLAYRLDVQAPDAIRKLLVRDLDLARFQSVPATDNIDASELDRLIRAAPAQARALLETEGYFNAAVTAQRVPAGVVSGAAAGAGDEAALPQVRVEVGPGPRAAVSAFTLEATGELQTAAAAGDAAATVELASLRSAWPLRLEEAFSQEAWSNAKNRTLARARADGYAAAHWSHTNARVEAEANRVALTLELDSGPRFRVGALQIEGLSRYEEDVVRRLANFGPGALYTEKLLLDFQERLQKGGLLEGASVELDPDPANATAAIVHVRVKELPLQQVTVGVGYSANTGARLSLEHTHRNVFDSRLIAKTKIVLGPAERSLEAELTSHPLADLYRNLVSGGAKRLEVDDQLQRSWNLRVGRARDTPVIERTYYVEVNHAGVDSSTVTSLGDAVSLNYHWVHRNVDNVLLPTRGLTTSLQGAFGYSHGTQTALGRADIDARGPFTRLYGRLTWYQPLGGTWYGTARAEAGEVFTGNVVGVPDTLLFRAGGDDSVRGYDYRTLGPTINGVTVSGRTLLTGSLEIARPIVASRPEYWGAFFVDAGNAADRWIELKPAFGYGFGLRWRSPVGPLRVDLAYGQQTHAVRLHVGVGVVF